MAGTNTSKVWNESEWLLRDLKTRQRALACSTEMAAWEVIVREARTVLRTYSTSFFIVTRFLPAAKRSQVEVIYAAVRYPDEVVDTFPISSKQRAVRIEEWSNWYEQALRRRSLKEALEAGTPCFAVAFARVVSERGIPVEHYRAFLEAMKMDIHPRRFATLDDLIESYIYGSAIVVGYFLTYVYGAERKEDFDRALLSARDLGIALQLTNFLRDVAEDQRRGRIYLPQDMLQEAGIENLDATDPRQHSALNRVLARLTAISEQYYDSSLANLDAFAADSRTAIRACIDVYRQLNQRIAQSPRGVLHRESVPAKEKFKALPPSKYWRLPLAYLWA